MNNGNTTSIPNSIKSETVSITNNQLDLNQNVYVNAVTVEEVLNAIAHLVPRLFYSDPVVILMDTFIYCRRGLTAKELSSITGFDNTKYVEITLRAMLDASLISCVTSKTRANQLNIGSGMSLSKDEMKLQQRNALGGATTTDTFIYYLDYVKLINVTTYRLDKILEEISLSKKKRKDKFKNKHGNQIEGEFWSCSICRSNFEPLDISMLMTQHGEFVCPLCDSHPILKYYASPDASDAHSESLEESSKQHPPIIRQNSENSQKGPTIIQPDEPLNREDVNQSLYYLQSLLKKCSQFESIPIKFGREKDLVDILEEARIEEQNEALAASITEMASNETIEYKTKSESNSVDSYLSDTDALGMDVTKLQKDVVPWLESKSTKSSKSTKKKNKVKYHESSDDEFD